MLGKVNICCLIQECSGKTRTRIFNLCWNFEEELLFFAISTSLHVVELKMTVWFSRNREVTQRWIRLGSIKWGVISPNHMPCRLTNKWFHLKLQVTKYKDRYVMKAKEYKWQNAVNITTKMSAEDNRNSKVYNNNAVSILQTF